MCDRDLRTGAWNVLPHLPTVPGWWCAVVLLVAGVATMVGLQRGSARSSPC